MSLSTSKEKITFIFCFVFQLILIYKIKRIISIDIQHPFIRQSINKHISITSSCLRLLLIILRPNYSNIDELSFMDNCLLAILGIGFFVYIYINTYTQTQTFPFFLCFVNPTGTCVCVQLKGKFMPCLYERNDH